MRANYFNQYGWNQFRVRNINEPVNGVRPDPTLGNISLLETTASAESQGLDVNFNFNYQPRRLFGVFGYTHRRAQELQRQRPDAAGRQHRTSRPSTARRPTTSATASSASSTRSCSGACAWGSTSGRCRVGPYNITSGFDTNQDGVINERPAGPRPQRRPAALAEQHRPASELEPWLRTAAHAVGSWRRAGRHGWARWRRWSRWRWRRLRRPDGRRRPGHAPRGLPADVQRLQPGELQQLSAP